MALKALEMLNKLRNTFIIMGTNLFEPRKIQPKITTRAVVRYKAFKGKPSPG